MKITHYSFGKIIIDEKAYSSDVIIYPDRIDDTWWRKEGHLLQKEDLNAIIAAGVSIIIVGTGYYATMRVPKETLEYIKSKNILLHVKDTQQAVRLYNELSEKQPVIAALHLTC